MKKSILFSVFLFTVIYFSGCKTETAPKSSAKFSLKEAKNKAIAYLQKNNLRPNNSKETIEVYSKTKIDIKNPSKWITELYIPIYPNTIAIKSLYSKKNDSAIAIPPTNSTIETLQKK